MAERVDAPVRVTPRIITVIALDCISWIIGIVAVMAFFERSVFEYPVPVVLGAAVVAQVIFGMLSGLYRGRFQSFSFDEAGAVALTAAPVGLTLIGLEFVLDNDPRTGQILVLATAIAVILMFGYRYVQRLIANRRRRERGKHRIPIVIYGAGNGGYRAVQATLTSPSSPYRSVALIDDDPAKAKLRIGGVRVEGSGADLARVAKRHNARHVLLALPASSGQRLSELHELIAEAELETLVMPPVQRLVGTGSTREFTRYRDEEILRRKIVEIDTDAVRGLVQGTSVLVTGAGGSIGSELVRQLVEFKPAVITALDHDDSLLHGVMQSVPEDLRKICRPALADIRDQDRLNEVFAEARPSLVFHAAALKHVPALEMAPGEGWKTNVLGTANVLEVCQRHGVTQVVNISTDKAADPGNVLGFTKRIAERLTAAKSNGNSGLYVSVRFGNVIGSRGSVMETFERQIAEGGPVTVTDPDVTRYFMAIREAVRLTMQAATIGRAGETLVLDMGAPVRIGDVAQQLVENAEEPVQIVYTGLRPGEKMHEVLVGLDEEAERPFHPMIDHVEIPVLDLVDALDRCAQHGVSPVTTDGLRHIAYLPAKDSLRPQVEVEVDPGRR
jgi:FlaA1/EpsC-like NDP-sugar epimerase